MSLRINLLVSLLFPLNTGSYMLLYWLKAHGADMHGVATSWLLLVGALLNAIATWTQVRALRHP